MKGTATAAVQDTCQDCPSYTYSGVGIGLLTNCTCNKGYTGPDGVECTACIAGTFKDVNGSALCSLCSGGHFSLAIAAISNATCNTCPAGKFQATAGSSDCTECEAGAEASSSASVSCEKNRHTVPNKTSEIIAGTVAFVVAMVLVVLVVIAVVAFRRSLQKSKKVLEEIEMGWQNDIQRSFDAENLKGRCQLQCGYFDNPAGTVDPAGIVFAAFAYEDTTQQDEMISVSEQREVIEMLLDVQNLWRSPDRGIDAAYYQDIFELKSKESIVEDAAKCENIKSTMQKQIDELHCAERNLCDLHTQIAGTHDPGHPSGRQ